jgi:hypothetical protein
MALVGTRCERSIDFIRSFRLALMTLLILLPYGFLQATTSDRLFSIATARSYFSYVLRASLAAQADTERAAFIIGHEDGSLSCQLWPPMNRYHQEVFHGSLPSGTLAIIHTHPNGSPRPSVEDQLEADRLGIPIYVLTRREVFKAEPGQTVATSVVRRQWWLSDHSSVDQQRCRQ